MLDNIEERLKNLKKKSQAYKIGLDVINLYMMDTAINNIKDKKRSSSELNKDYAKVGALLAELNNDIDKSKNKEDLILSLRNVVGEVATLMGIDTDKDLEDEDVEPIYSFELNGDTVTVEASDVKIDIDSNSRVGSIEIVNDDLARIINKVLDKERKPVVIRELIDAAIENKKGK